MRQRGGNPIVVMTVVMVILIGLIVVYSTMAEPVEEIKDYVLGKMDSHTGPIENFWRIFGVAGLFLFGAVLIWAYLSMQEEEYERARRYYPRGRY